MEHSGTNGETNESQSPHNPKKSTSEASHRSEATPSSGDSEKKPGGKKNQESNHMTQDGQSSKPNQTLVEPRYANQEIAQPKKPECEPQPSTPSSKGTDDYNPKNSGLEPNGLTPKVPAPALNSNPKFPAAVTVRGMKDSTEITESEMYKKCLESNQNWSTDEIKYAWKTLAEYPGKIHDWWAFVEGTIKKFRDKKLSDKISKKPDGYTKENTKEVVTMKAPKSTFSEEEIKANLAARDHTPAKSMYSGYVPVSERQRKIDWLKSYNIPESEWSKYYKDL